MQQYNVLVEATNLVDGQLELIAEVFGSKKALIEAGSRFVCSCRSCRGYTEQTLSWLAGFTSTPAEAPRKPVTLRTRLFPTVDASTQQGA